MQEGISRGVEHEKVPVAVEIESEQIQIDNLVRIGGSDELVALFGEIRKSNEEYVIVLDIIRQFGKNTMTTVSMTVGAEKIADIRREIASEGAAELPTKKEIADAEKVKAVESRIGDSAITEKIELSDDIKLGMQIDILKSMLNKAVTETIFLKDKLPKKKERNEDQEKIFKILERKVRALQGALKACQNQLSGGSVDSKQEAA